MSDLWFVPPSTDSAWFSRLDWYLNWQMCKSFSHQAAPASAELSRIATEHGLNIENPRIELGRSALMVASNGLIPARACVVLAYTGDLKEWLGRVKNLALQMQAKQIRVYLPADATKTQAANHWKKIPGHCSAQFMDDLQDGEEPKGLEDKALGENSDNEENA